MAQTRSNTVGIEYDNGSIRAVRVAAAAKDRGQVVIEKAECLDGAFAADDALVEGLRKIREMVGAGGRGKIVTCLSGKQIYAAQLQFRRLPDEEMKNALRFEIRKNLPFESSGSTIDYQFLEGDKKSGEGQVLVSASSNTLMDRHVRLTGKAGFKPDIVEVLPFALANAFWAAAGEPHEVNLIVHIGPEMCSLVIDGAAAPFFHRTIYFSAAELYGVSADANISARERERRLTGLAEELNRSITYYESDYQTANFRQMHVTGPFCDPGLIQELAKRCGLAVEPLGLVKKTDPKRDDGDSGMFDVALALAMR